MVIESGKAYYLYLNLPSNGTYIYIFFDWLDLRVQLRYGSPPIGQR